MEDNSEDSLRVDIVGLLPPELGQMVLSYLSAKNLAVCSGVCRKWRDLTNCNPIWRRHCIKETWCTLDMVENYRTHFSKKLTKKENNENLLNLCSWRINYERHYELPLNWERNRSCQYRLVDRPPVTCLHCDSIRLATGCEDGSVIVLNVNKVPYLEYRFEGLLNSKIISLKIFGKYCIVQQCMLLQIFEDEYFVDAKSFDLGLSMIEVLPRSGVSPEELNTWYKPGKYKDVFFEIYLGNLYATHRDAQCIYVWSLRNGKRITAIHVTNHMCKMRDMCFKKDRIYIIFAASRSVRHISVYDITIEKWIFEVTTPLCKTQKIMCADSLLVGVAVAGPALTCTGVINVWDISNGKLVSERHTQEFLSRSSVSTAYDVIIYSTTTTVNIWEPRTDTLIRRLTTDGNPLFLKTLPFIYVAVFTDKTAYVWDWFNGSKRFRLFSKYNAEMPEFMFADETMILLLDERSSVQMIGFC
ncbi:uncharacterized protein [Rhodnius prolixus]|uniref:uncharacterized protein n=1 Tax=Rhodnius prolixus TaxID=13249 RepID=UPI003D18E3E9